MDAVLLDLHYAVRNLVRRPGFSLLAVLTLAIGIGVNTVAFSAVNALLFHPFVFPGVERLGWVMLGTAGNPHGDLSWPEFVELEQSTKSFDAVAAEGRTPLALQADGRTEQIFALLVSADYFHALDSRAEIGRVLQGADARAAGLAAVVSHRFWQDRLGGGSLAGRTLSIAHRSISVVGVMPDDFQGPGGLYAPDVWLPLEQMDALSVPATLREADNRWLTVIARTAPGVALPQARAELASFAAHLNATAPPRPGTDSRQVAVHFYPMRDGHPEVRGLAPYAWVAMAIVGVVLLIACFNVAALLLARASERRREIGIRTALGAGRGRLVRQMLTEGMLLSAVSGVAAIGLAAWSTRLLTVFSLPSPIPQRLHMAVDARLIAFTLGMVAVAGVLPALLPALQSTRRSIARSMRLDAGFGDSRTSRSRSAFVIAQIAGSTLFLATALLFVRSFLVAAAFNPGFDLDRAVVATIDPLQYGTNGARGRALVDDVLQRLSSSPAIAIASAADRVPFYVGYPRAEIVAAPGEDCTPNRCKPVTSFDVLPGHFAALGIPLVAGRDLTSAEARTGTAVVVSEAMAQQRWPNQSAIGQPLRIGRDGRSVQVVGVAADVKLHTVGEIPPPVLYRPLTDDDLTFGVSLTARAASDPRAAMAAIRDALHAAAPDVPLASVQTMRDRLALPLWPYRTGAGFFLICGTLALVLATVGLFGVTYFAVRQRTREFGIRIAIGARSADVVRQVLGEGLRLSLPGAALGLAGALVAGRLLARALVGVSPADPLSLVAAAAVEATVALLACALPARRATQSDPMLALRDE